MRTNTHTHNFIVSLVKEGKRIRVVLYPDFLYFTPFKIQFKSDIMQVDYFLLFCYSTTVLCVCVVTLYTDIVTEHKYKEKRVKIKSR